MGKKVLIIDDNEQDRKIMQRYLKRSGYEDVLMAGSGEEGVGKAESEKPDLIVIDTLLPGINGFETCKQIRERLSPDAAKIIVMTGSVDAVDAVKAKRSGADDYCVKTSDAAPLLEAVKNIFGAR